jgi:hypothetical protein
MTTGSFLIVFLILVLSGMFIARPFFTRSNLSGRSSSSIQDSLIAERERLLSAIEELDLELDLNKISPKEHSRNRDLLLAEAAGIIKQLDNLKPGQKTGKAKKQTPAADPKSDELEKMIAERRQQLRAEKSLVCNNCGGGVLIGDLFCSHCGETL